MSISPYVITGMGVSSPIGTGQTAFWSGLLNNTSAMQQLAIFDPLAEAVSAGKVDLSTIPHPLSPRIRKKLDNFTQLSFLAAHQALDAALILNSSIEERLQIGVILGNSLGGWSFVEPQMHGLYYDSFDTLNPYVATAWFPTAAQGELSIFYQLGGYSKTLCAGKLSAGYALLHAIEMLESNAISGCLVGGCEAPLTALVHNSCIRYPNTAIGQPLSEAAAMIYVEKEEEANRRQANILGRVQGWGMGSTLKSAIESCLNAAARQPTDIQVILIDDQATAAKTETTQVLGDIFCNHPTVYISTPQLAYGYTFAAEAALKCIVALSLLQEQTLPTAHSHFLFPATAQKQPTQPLQSILLNTSDENGQYMSLLIEQQR